ncbi:MAG: hypothetical protein ACRDNB_00100 [Gaiellaceae bacterium]
MTWWRKLPLWIRVPVGVVVLVVLVYAFGVLAFGCGSETAESIGWSARPWTGAG